MQELQDLLIGKFISRADCFALQGADGKWFPAREDTPGVPFDQKPLIPWSRDFLQAHIDGDITTGHYMLGLDSTVKLIAFDIDWKEQGHLPVSYTSDGVPEQYELTNPREAWHDRSNIHRSWMKSRIRELSHKIAAIANRELEIPVACAYSGNKGVHVYAFTDTLPASEARIAADLVMKTLGTFQLSRGTFEWTDANPDIDFTYNNMTVEVFPKQDEVSENGFGNLMAMPLGINRKHPEDPKFFIDMRAPMNAMTPVDPIWALSTPNPWA